MAGLRVPDVPKRSGHPERSVKSWRVIESEPFEFAALATMAATSSKRWIVRWLRIPARKLRNSRPRRPYWRYSAAPQKYGDVIRYLRKPSRRRLRHL